ncbi:MAG: family transposase, partial [Chlamydiales bacterium]|nr:family transposase [Chlamydiales bacterium]
GLNENTNGLIRQYIPKQQPISVVGEDFIAFIEQSLNTRPRKTLQYFTPEEIYNQKNKEAA